MTTALGDEDLPGRCAAPSGTPLNCRAMPCVPLCMWDDRRLTAALAALPPEAFIEGAPEDGELLWRRTARRLHRELGGGAPDAPPPGYLAPVVRLYPDQVD